jgi:AraC family transcriptional regulator, activator of mtrCDE
MPRTKTIIEYRHYSLPIDFPVLLLSGERWRISDRKSDRLHFHNHLEIGVCHSDGGYMEIGDSLVSFKAGDVTCIPRYLPHTTYSSPGTASRWSYLFFSPEELFKDIFEHTSFSSAPVPVLPSPRHDGMILSGEDYPLVYTLTTSVVDTLCRKGDHYGQTAYGLLLALYTELVRLYTQREKRERAGEQDTIPPSARATVLLPALEYIANHYMTPVTIDALSGLCHLSTVHFRRKFTDVMGASPLDFVNSTRIDEACKLLKSTERSILSISEQVGFRSISSFNRCFLKLIGESPKSWRAKAVHPGAQSAKASILKRPGWV